MKAKGLSITRTVNSLPDGHYKGRWGGYLVTLEIGGDVYYIDTNIGIRSMSAPCVVVVKDGEIAVEAI